MLFRSGYVLNPNEQKVTFTYVDDKTPVIKESLTFSDDRQKLDMSVTKLDAEDNTPIAGAVFGLYADEDIKNADGKVIIDKGTLLEKATSDENGKIAFVKDYPFAKYVARELVCACRASSARRGPGPGICGGRTLRAGLRRSCGWLRSWPDGRPSRC